MSGIAAIPPISATYAASMAPTSLVSAGQVQGGSFGALLTQGLHQMEVKVGRADELVKRFAVDDSVPVHQVTYALEEARLSVELAMQVRSRVVEAYRDLMNMQL